jgi:t-SNARE complex subunit (syntaxin)
VAPAPDERSVQSVQERYRRLKAQEPTRRERLISYALVGVFLITIVVVAVLFMVFVVVLPRGAR